jgi:hypothetical protein
MFSRLRVWTLQHSGLQRRELWRKRRSTSTKLHSSISQKDVVFVLATDVSEIRAALIIRAITEVVTTETSVYLTSWDNFVINKYYKTWLQRKPRVHVSVPHRFVFSIGTSAQYLLLLFWKLLAFVSLLGTSETFLCSTFVLQLKTVLLLDVLQLRMLFAGTLISLKDKTFHLNTFYCKQDTAYMLSIYLIICVHYFILLLLFFFVLLFYVLWYY